jgi:hypothetical protein
MLGPEAICLECERIIARINFFEAELPAGIRAGVPSRISAAQLYRSTADRCTSLVLDCTTDTPGFRELREESCQEQHRSSRNSGKAHASLRSENILTVVKNICKA